MKVAVFVTPFHSFHAPAMFIREEPAARCPRLDDDLFILIIIQQENKTALQ
jgi:hypothetical protein